MKSFLQFLSESDSSSEFSTAVDRLLSQLKGTKLIDPDTGLPKPLYRGTSARPNFDFAETGNISPRHQTWGPGQYWSTSPSYAGRYTKIIPSSTKVEQPWFLRPFKSPITKTTYSYAPGSRILTGYANIQNPIEMHYGQSIEDVGKRLGINIPVHSRNTDYLAQIQSALDKRGIDAIRAYDKNMGELVPHEIWNIRDPKKVIVSPHVLAPQTTQTTSPKPPTPPPTTPKPLSGARLSGARRGAVSADTLATMAGVGSAVVGGMAAGAGAALNTMAGLLTGPANKDRMYMEKMTNSDMGLGFDLGPDGELEASPAGLKAARERQKTGFNFPTWYPTDLYK